MGVLSSNRYLLKIRSTVYTVRSAWAFAYGYPAVIVLCYIPYYSKRGVTAPKNSFPLSDLIRLGHPCLHIIRSTMKSFIRIDYLLGIASNSTNLLKASMATMTCLFPFFVVGKLVIRSIATTSKGYLPFSVGR